MLDKYAEHETLFPDRFRYTHLNLNLLHVLVENCSCLLLRLWWGRLWLLLFVVTHSYEHYIRHKLLFHRKTLPVPQKKNWVRRLFTPSFLYLKFTLVLQPTVCFPHQHVQGLPFYILLHTGVLLDEVLLVGLWPP